MNSQIGTVKWFNETKGFGFITPDEKTDNGKDIFLHITALRKSGIKTLEEGDRVSFALEESRGKMAAVAIKLIKAARGE